MQKILVLGLLVVLILTVIVSGADDKGDDNGDDRGRSKNWRAICRLPPDTGSCDGICPRYYYDYKRRTCRRFDYGCCDGNANNFKTRAQCQKVCQNDRD